MPLFVLPTSVRYGRYLSGRALREAGRKCCFPPVHIKRCNRRQQMHGTRLAGLINDAVGKGVVQGFLAAGACKNMNIRG